MGRCIDCTRNDNYCSCSIAATQSGHLNVMLNGNLIKREDFIDYCNTLMVEKLNKENDFVYNVFKLTNDKNLNEKYNSLQEIVRDCKSWLEKKGNESQEVIDKRTVLKYWFEKDESYFSETQKAIYFKLKETFEKNLKDYSVMDSKKIAEQELLTV